MTSVTCPQCQLINFATATNCIRCRAALNLDQPAIVTDEAYVLPPPPGAHPSEGVWRFKSQLVMSKVASLPRRCLKCNQPTEQLLKRKLSWHHPALYLLAPFALLIYALVAMAIRKNATVQIPLCEMHLAKRRQSILITIGILLVAVASFVVAGTVVSGDSALILILIGVALIFVATIYGIITLRVVAPAKIDDHYLWLTGVNRAYLDQLPPWPYAS